MESHGKDDKSKRKDWCDIEMIAERFAELLIKQVELQRNRQNHIKNKNAYGKKDKSHINASCL